MPNLISRLPEKRKTGKFIKPVEVTVVDGMGYKVITIFIGTESKIVEGIYSQLCNLFEKTGYGEKYSVVMTEFR